MKKSLICALILGFASTALAGARRPNKADDKAMKMRDAERPAAEIAQNREVRIEITDNTVLRSCCRPPDLIVGGKLTNLTSHPIDYVRLIIAMKDSKGRVVYTEDTHNHGAVTMFEDPQLAKVLNDKPHFDPLAPGAGDTFLFDIPLLAVPNFKSVLVMATDVVRNATVAKAP